MPSARRSQLERLYRAVIFDMDGVLADSEPVYRQALDAVLEPLGFAVTPALHEALMGHGVEATFEALKRALALPGAATDYIPAYDRELVRRLAQLRRPLAGARELVVALRKRGVPVGVASSSLPAWMEALLGGIGLRDAFDSISSAAEVARPKPAPDLYLLAAAKLGVEPAVCVAVEDTPTGLRAARAAGMFAVQVRAASTAFPPLAEADLVLDSLADFDQGLLAAG